MGQIIMLLSTDEADQQEVRHLVFICPRILNFSDRRPLVRLWNYAANQVKRFWVTSSLSFAASRSPQILRPVQVYA